MNQQIQQVEQKKAPCTFKIWKKGKCSSFKKEQKDEKKKEKKKKRIKKLEKKKEKREKERRIKMKKENKRKREEKRKMTSDRNIEGNSISRSVNVSTVKLNKLCL